MVKKVEILQKQEVFKRFFFRIEEAQLRHEKLDGTMSEILTRLNFNRGDSVAIIIHDAADDTIVLSEQFRYPTYDEKDDQSTGWLVEIPAGTIEPGETPEACVRREVQEEIGYNITQIEYITSFFLSPGGTSEQIHLYYTQVTPKQQTSSGGGLISEGEDIRILKVKFAEALKMATSGRLKDAKSLIGVQWLQLKRLTTPVQK